MKGEGESASLKSSIKWFSELGINSKEIAGEKASYLSEVYNKNNFSKNINIPAGFVITKNAIESFFDKSNIRNAISNIFNEIDKSNLDELKSASSKIKNLIMKTEFPEEIQNEISEAYDNLSDDELEKGEGLAYDILSNATEPSFVAVRASYRNDLGDSYFNIKGVTNVIYSIKRVVSSLFDTDAILEEINSGIKIEDITTAIVIQKMIQADKSGIVYSGDTIVTNAVWGLGGALKLSEVGADEYVVDRSLRVVSKEINEKKYAITRESSGALKLVGLKEGYSFMQVLEEHEAQEVSNIILRLDDIFGCKTQFEFAVVEGEISIVKVGKVSQRPDAGSEKREVESQEKDLEVENVTDSNIELELVEPEISPTVETGVDIIPEVSPVVVEEVNEKKEEVEEVITQTKIDVLITENSLGENSNPANARSGFLTLENIIKARGVHPSKYMEDLNTKGYGEVILNGLQMNAKDLDEIWVRLSDFDNKDFSDLDGAVDEVIVNPIMGLNGIRYLLTNPELLKRELNAISKLKVGNREVGVLIPKVSSIYELKKVKEIMESLNINIKVGIILETPASIQLIKDFIEDGIDAVVFSGDTLTEYLLALDSSNLETYKFYDDTNPALMYQLEYVIRVCNRKNVKTSFFGSATNKKEMIDYLVRKNINTIIVPTDKISAIKNLVYDAEKEFVHGTDKEIRQYEMNVERDRQKKEIEEFEAVKEEVIRDKMVEDGNKAGSQRYASTSTSVKDKKTFTPAEICREKAMPDAGSNEEKTVEENVSDVPVANSEKMGAENLDNVEDAIKLIEEEKKEFLNVELDPKNVKIEENASKSLVIHPDNMNVEIPESVEDAMKLIDEHNDKSPALTETELAMNKIDSHNSKDKISNITKDEKEGIDSVILEKEVQDPNDSLPEFGGGNIDLKNSNEEFEEIPENLNEIDASLSEEKLSHDIELIEGEKREYLESSDYNEVENASDSTNQEDVLDKNLDSVNDKKDVLGIF